MSFTPTEAPASVNIGAVVTSVLIIIFGLIVALDVITYSSRAKYRASLSSIKIRPKGRRSKMKEVEKRKLKRGREISKQRRRRKVAPVSEERPVRHLKYVSSEAGKKPQADQKSLSVPPAGERSDARGRGGESRKRRVSFDASVAKDNDPAATPVIPLTCNAAMFGAEHTVHRAKNFNLLSKYYRGKEGLSYQPRPNPLV